MTNEEILKVFEDLPEEKQASFISWLRLFLCSIQGDTQSPVSDDPPQAE